MSITMNTNYVCERNIDFTEQQNARHCQIIESNYFTRLISRFYILPVMVSKLGYKSLISGIKELHNIQKLFCFLKSKSEKYEHLPSLTCSVSSVPIAGY